MALRLIIKSDFGKMEAMLEALPEKIDRALTETVNSAGYEISRNAVNMIASHIGASPAAVEQAILRRAASTMDPSYTIEATDAKFPMVRWRTQRDEKVCKICGPRDGHLFTTMEVRYMFPAHPNCRCQLEQVSIARELVAAAPDAEMNILGRGAERVMEVIVKGWTG